MPSLSITIPGPTEPTTGGPPRSIGKRTTTAPPTAQQEQHDDMEPFYSGSEESEDDVKEEDSATARRTVKFVGPDGEQMSDAESSICESPSWEGYGRQKQKKKEKANKRKEEREQADRETKAAKKRLAARLSKNPPSAPTSRPGSRTANPMALTERSMSAPVLANRAAPFDSGSRPGPRPLGDANVSLANSAFNMARLFGSRKGDLEKRLSVKKPEMITYVPLSYSVGGYVALAPNVSQKRRESVDSLNSSSWSGRYEDSKAGEAPALVQSLPPRDHSHPPSASRSHALLLATSQERTRSSSMDPKLSGRGGLRSTSKTREPSNHGGSKSASASSTSSDSAPPTPVANERGRTMPRGSYVHSVRAQSSDRAFSGFMDEQLVNMANDVATPKQTPYAVQPLLTPKAQSRAKAFQPKPVKRLSAREAMENEPSQAHRTSKKSSSEQQDHLTRSVSAQTAEQAEPLRQDLMSALAIGAEETEFKTGGSSVVTCPASHQQTPLDFAPGTASTEDNSTDDTEQHMIEDLSLSPSSLGSRSGNKVAGHAPISEPSNRRQTTTSALAGQVPNGASNPAPRPRPRNAKLSERLDVNSSEDFISAIQRQSMPNSPRMATERAFLERQAKSPRQREIPESHNQTVQMVDPTVSSQSVSLEAARGVDLVPPPQPPTSLPSPSAPGFKSTGALLPTAKVQPQPKRASSSLGFNREDSTRSMSAKPSRGPKDAGSTALQRPATATTAAKVMEGSSSSSSFDDISSFLSPASTPESSRPQSRRGHSKKPPSTSRSVKEVTAISEDEDDNGAVLLDGHSSLSSHASDYDHEKAKPPNAASIIPRSPLDDSWSRTALPLDPEHHDRSDAMQYEDEPLSKADFINLESAPPAPGPFGPQDGYEVIGKPSAAQIQTMQADSYPRSAPFERSTSPSLRGQAMSPPGSKARNSPFRRPQLPPSDSVESGKSSGSSDAGKPGAPRLRSALVSSSSSSISGIDISSGSNASAAYLQEARKSAPNSSRNSSSSRPHHPGALARPNLTNGAKPQTSSGPAAKLTGVTVPPEQQRPLAKMLVECCNCHFYHDLPSKLYEYMARDESIIEDKLLGVAGAITTAVKCPWCTHSMSTKCCAGYAAVVYLKERLH
jgi:hypothetical protein